MIIVIADDLTGAVELGGVALRHGLSAQVSLDLDISAITDVLIIATDTRSRTEKEAIAETQRLCALLSGIKPQLIYKKIDSALRGHTLAETKAQMSALGLTKALLVPANPATGRTIEGGRYLINGTPINQTSFKDDPEFPANGAHVSELLRSSQEEISVKKNTETLEAGISVAEVSDPPDLQGWTKHVDEQTLIAGGAAFFEILLNTLTKSSAAKAEGPELKGIRLYVSGTAYSESVELISSLESSGKLCYFPPFIEQEQLSTEELDEWLTEAAEKLSQAKALVVAFKNDPERKNIKAADLREKTALIVNEIFKRLRVDELIIEGGSTASSILHLLEIKLLYPEQELAPGVVRSRAPEKGNLYVTLKPGSYKWPPEIWPF